jgi:hypothetical protein
MVEAGIGHLIITGGGIVSGGIIRRSVLGVRMGLMRTIAAGIDTTMIKPEVSLILCCRDISRFS